MGEKVLKMAASVVKKQPSPLSSCFAEDPRAQYLLTGTNPEGKTAYFSKIQITGLCDRIFGPYNTRSRAIECFDMVLGAALESFIDVENTHRSQANGVEHIALPHDLTSVPVNL